MQKGTNLIVAILVVLFFLNVLAWLAVFELAKPQYLEVTFFDVGQGDSTFIETPQRHQILIDGGPDATVLEKLGKEIPFWDRTIDLVILTHPEQDHIAGLLEVLKNYKVENILWTGVKRDTSEYDRWVELLEKEKTNIFFTQNWQEITCMYCRRGRWAMNILFPLQNIAGEFSKNSNDTSVVAKLTIGKQSFLFTGDIEKSIERRLVNEGLNLDSVILKVAHHGSKTSTAPEFVAAASPKFAVISAGRDNRYGHPHPKTLETLEQYGVEIFRTDILGDIKIISDGISLQAR